MADEGAWRTTQIVHRFGLERKESQYVINVALHRTRPTRTPCPDRGTNVIHDRDVRGALGHAPCHAMGKFRAVDDNQNIRICRDDGIGGFPYAWQKFREPPWNRGKSHCRKITAQKD